MNAVFGSRKAQKKICRKGKIAEQSLYFVRSKYSIIVYVPGKFNETSKIGCVEEKELINTEKSIVAKYVFSNAISE